MARLMKRLVRAVHQSEEKMKKNPKKEKKRVKFSLCSSVDVMDSSSAAPKGRDKPPSSSSTGKRIFKGLRRFFGRIFTSCRRSSSSEQTSSIQTQKTRDNLSTVGGSSEQPPVDLLNASPEKEAVRAVVVDGSSSSEAVRSSEPNPSPLQTSIEETEPITVAEEPSPPRFSIGGPSTSADSFSLTEEDPDLTLDAECIQEFLDSLGVQWRGLSQIAFIELVRSLLEDDEASEKDRVDADKAALGLPNLENTCYMNSIIQCLFSVSPFRGALLSQQENLTDSATLTRALCDLHMSRTDSSASDMKETLLDKVKSYIESHFPVFKGNYQQDAHEFLMACLSCLKEESMSVRSSHPSYTCPVSNMEFKLSIERTCRSCGLKKTFTEDSNYLSLNPRSHASLTGSLQQYMSASLVDCECSLCGGAQASETLKFLTLPRVLVLLVQRFDIMSSMMKLKDRLEIPEELTLPPSKGTLLFKHLPSGGQIQNGCDSVEERPLYTLSAVVSHVGSHLCFGHYISQIRDPSEDGWLWCSDASVRRSSWSEVSEDAEVNGYLLFYVQS